jgi:hypothetical protein
VPGARRVGGPAADPAPAPRRSPRPFAGSLRQRRGQLLRRVLADGAVTAGDADPEAAAGLIEDGLVVLVRGRLRAPR